MQSSKSPLQHAATQSLLGLSHPLGNGVHHRGLQHDQQLPDLALLDTRVQFHLDGIGNLLVLIEQSVRDVHLSKLLAPVHSHSVGPLLAMGVVLHQDIPGLAISGLLCLDLLLGEFALQLRQLRPIRLTVGLRIALLLVLDVLDPVHLRDLCQGTAVLWRGCRCWAQAASWAAAGARASRLFLGHRALLLPGLQRQVLHVLGSVPLEAVVGLVKWKIGIAVRKSANWRWGPLHPNKARALDRLRLMGYHRMICKTRTDFALADAFARLHAGLTYAKLDVEKYTCCLTPRQSEPPVTHAFAERLQLPRANQ